MIRPIALFGALVLGAALSACTSPDARMAQSAGTAPRYASLDALALGRPDAMPAPQRTATPVVVLPAWIGRPVRLREREDGDTLEQAVSLAPAPRGEKGENLMLVTMPRSGAALARLTDGAMPSMGRPTEAAIRGEIEAAFPGTAMQVVARPASNTYGPYGLAVGRSAGGARCLYAWQWIEEAPAMEGLRAAPVSLRIRLCRADITLEAMAAAVNQLRLVPRFEGAPVAAPSAQAPATGSVRRHARRAVAEARPTRHGTPPRIAALPPAAAAPYPVEAPARAGRRYLGDDPGSEATTRPTVATAGLRSVLAVSSGAPATAGTIAADLPPEAYRGPAGARP